MSKQYEKLMDHIQVTPEMAERILKNLEGTRRKSRAPGYLAAGLAAAACLALLISTPLFRPAPRPQAQMAPAQADIQMVNGIEEAQSPEALAQLVGFHLPPIPELPFETEAIAYSSYWNNMAQITCSGSENTAVLRMTPGTKDCSGDYTEYPTEEVLEVQDLSITLKGKEDAFQLAVWSDGEYSYSVRMQQGVPAEQWEKILISFRND